MRGASLGGIHAIERRTRFCRDAHAHLACARVPHACAVARARAPHQGGACARPTHDAEEARVVRLAAASAGRRGVLPRGERVLTTILRLRERHAADQPLFPASHDAAVVRSESLDAIAAERWRHLSHWRPGPPGRAMTVSSRRAAGLDPEPVRPVHLPSRPAGPPLVRRPAGGRDPRRHPRHASATGAARARSGAGGRGRDLGGAVRRRGARLYHVVTDWSAFSGHLGDIPRIQQGGLGIYGAILGGAIGATIGARRYGVPLLVILDCTAPGTALAQAIGRFGNYANQELFGGPTNLPWGSRSIRPTARPSTWKTRPSTRRSCTRRSGA